jgi:HEAT repeat protein
MGGKTLLSSIPSFILEGFSAYRIASGSKHPMRWVRLLGLALVAYAWSSPTLPANDAISADEELLHSEKIGTQTSELLSFVRSQIRDADLNRQIETLIAQLASDRAAVRAEASRKLIAIGAPALASLKRAAESRDNEVKSRAEACLAEIRQGPGPHLVVAAVHVLVQRRPAEALKLLLDYAADVGDDGVEEEVLAGLAALGVRGGQVEPLLVKAASDPLPGRRAAVACVLARAGGVDQRGLVRQLLADIEPRVRRYAAHGLLGARFPRTDNPAAIADDEATLENAKLGSDAAALIEFFRKRTLRQTDVRVIDDLIKQLASDRFREREQASRKLIEFGPGALERLRPAARSSDQEVARRAELCIEIVTHHPGPALPTAALHLLARRPADEAVRVLLDYLPFADDARVEEEAVATLSILSVRLRGIDSALLDALKDGQPVRRAAAALVLGQVGDKDDCAAVRSALKDPDTRVRLRAAQGLLAARDKAALEPLIGLLTEGVVEQANQAEVLLQEVAGAAAPALAIGDGSPEARRKSQDAWLTWWRERGSKEELAGPGAIVRQLGLTLVAELIGNNAGGNRVAEIALDGKNSWELTNLQGPIDAHMLPGGRVLIAEHNGQSVTERDLKGNVKWQFKLNGNPVACQRLASGNTFIATYNAVMEVTPRGEAVYSHNPNPGIGGVLYDACKLPNGNIVCIGGRGTVVEMDTSGKKINTIQVGANGGWGGVAPLPNGRLLVAMMNPGKVVEVDRAGKIHWEAAVSNACHAVRLPNGNTLVACMNTQKVVEVNRAGKIVWEKPTAGRPFHVERR